MFAYCRNNPVSQQDASGTNDTCAVDFNQYRNPLDDLGNPSGGSSHGVGTTVQGMASIGCAFVVMSSVGALTNNEFWLEGLIREGERALSEARAYARTMASGEKYVVHHIVAKAAVWADPTRKVLESVHIKVLTNGLNLAVIPEKMHKGLHTERYYTYVNSLFAGLDKNEEAIILTLVRLQIEIQVYCETGISTW